MLSWGPVLGRCRDPGGACVQAALLKKELVVKEAQDATAEKANQLSLQSAAAARLEEELVSLRADADAQREAGRRKAGEADERLEESVARLRDAEESVAARVRELTAVRDEMAVLQEEKSMLQRQVRYPLPASLGCRIPPQLANLSTGVPTLG